MATDALTLDARNARVSFLVRWFGVVPVRGTFRVVRGEVRPDATLPGGLRLSIAIDASSVTSGIALRDRHLRGPRFLHADLHPWIRFDGHAIRREAGELVVTGALTLRDSTSVTRASCPLDELQRTDDEVALCARFVTSRRQHDVGTAGGLMRYSPLLAAIGDAIEVRVAIDVPVAMVRHLDLVPQGARPRAATGHEDST